MVKEVLVNISAIMAALAVILGFIFTAYRWYLKQDKQDVDIKNIKAEQRLVIKGILACLQGLHEQGCDGAVTKAIAELQEHVIDQSHL